MKKRLISLFVALTMLLCLIPAAFAATFNAGTYTASANGMNGAVTVEVTFSDSAITDVKVSIFRSLVPITVLALLQIVISWVLLKNKRIRDLFDGKAVIIIENGMIDQQMMRKERYSIDDLMSQLHDKDLSSPAEVAFAILENNGTLSILPKHSCQVLYPEPLISDGEVSQSALRAIGKDEAWLNAQLKKKGIHSVQEVFLCLLQKNGLFLIRTQRAVSRKKAGGKRAGRS